MQRIALPARSVRSLPKQPSTTDEGQYNGGESISLLNRGVTRVLSGKQFQDLKDQSDGQILLEQIDDSTAIKLDDYMDGVWSQIEFPYKDWLIMFQEYFGTGLFGFIITGVQTLIAIQTVQYTQYVPSYIIGLAIAAAAFIVSNMCPYAHFNPWVSIATACNSIVSPLPRKDSAPTSWNVFTNLLMRMAFGVAGSFTFAQLVVCFADVNTAHPGLALPDPNLSLGYVGLFEGLWELVLILSVYGSSTHSPSKPYARPLPALVLFAGVAIFGPRTGGSFNPYRALGPAFVAGNYTGLGAQTIGQFFGTLVACVIIYSKQYSLVYLVNRHNAQIRKNLEGGANSTINGDNAPIVFVVRNE